MAMHPDWSSDSDDSLFDDDGDIYFKEKLKLMRASDIPHELSEEEKLKQTLNYLYNAIFSGCVEKVQELISTGINVNSELRDKWTSIMLAASYANADIIKLLIESGANINQTRDAVSPLMMACNCPDYTAPFEKSLEVIKLLVENGASVQAINRKRMDALMYAACNGHLPAVEYLLPKSNKQAVDNQQWSALTWAVSNNQFEVVKFLYEDGFDITLTDVRGNSPVDIARDNGLDAIIDLFPKRDIDLAETIESDCRKTFKETFEALEIGKKPAFFEDICNFLLAVKCEDLIPLFFEKKVHICEFLSMSDKDLKHIGVLLPYQRNRILTGLSRFHKQPYNPKSLHICIKNGSFSNIDVAIELLSAVKQVIAMEASIKYLLGHLQGTELSNEDRALLTRHVCEIKKQIHNMKGVTGKLKKVSKKLLLLRCVCSV
ncbi:ankyrin repeat, SAM and basic leucine zipper domain-containing protein 1 isoform X2 [Dendroctonus ponderosae]|uniref:ankyrin repeat, SAM and basic leucine zipper domain-containing protein 1 isoform X2 n=1 Tax=Dendroctonus ponderosae TaxID=77166 RepID=UPI002034B99D|nr:ankyrin repeat, SAM and basic leucine zipper domain-containing protein 1 isoform X2 [Dendroctonus ponderosae]